MKRSYAFFFGVLAFSVGFFASQEAYAGVGLTIQPIKISHTIKPGESVSGTILLRNESDAKVNIEIGVEDFVPAAGSTNIKFVGRAEGVTTVRDWVTLHLPENSIFQEGESRDIRYTITAPRDAEPGGHFGVAFFKATRLEETGQLKVGTRVGVLLFVTVPGNQLQKGNILDFHGPLFTQRGPVDFKIKFENTGTVHFEPKGSITITNILGKVVGKIPVQGQIVLPSGVRDLLVSWNVSGILLGRYQASMTLEDGEGNVLTSNNIAFYAFPLWYLLSFIIVVLALFFGIKFLRRKIKISVR